MRLVYAAILVMQLLDCLGFFFVLVSSLRNYRSCANGAVASCAAVSDAFKKIVENLLKERLAKPSPTTVSEVAELGFVLMSLAKAAGMCGVVADAILFAVPTYQCRTPVSSEDITAIALLLELFCAFAGTLDDDLAAGGAGLRKFLAPSSDIYSFGMHKKVAQQGTDALRSFQVWPPSFFTT